MSRLTRCPSCQTTFRVLQSQLAARKGRVRCGKCSAVFDGVAQLVSEPAEAPVDSVVPESPVTPPRIDPAPPPQAAPPTSGQVEAVEPTDEPPSPPPRQKILVPAFLEPERPGATYTAVWTVLALVALTLLIGQAILHFRTEIGVLLPATRTYLETACDTLGCEVRLPRRADLMSIESSDLQADSQRAGVIVLNALLRNRAPFAQEYPDLELTLTDQGDRPVVRRILRPVDYLQEKRSVVPLGMAGGAEESVRIFLDTGGLLATGYQLFLFYSCPAPSGSAFWQLSYPSRCQDLRPS
jgi:predicted Zn finger-like uncharacterized protein